MPVNMISRMSLLSAAITFLVIVLTPGALLAQGLPPLQAGWPPALGMGDGPHVVDLNFDGAGELVLPSPGWAMYVICSNGALCPDWSFQGFTSQNRHVCVGDITGDGFAEIVFHRSGTQLLEVLDRFGAPVAPFPLQLSLQGGWVSGGLQDVLLADIVPGGGLEIIVMNDGYSFDPHATVAAFQGTGELLPGWPKSYPDQYCTLASEDLDGDGFAEIVIATRNETLMGDAPCYVYHGDGTLLPGWPSVPSPWSGGFERTMSYPVIADMDGDGSREIVGKSEGRLFILRSDGSTFRDPFIVASYPTWPAIADLDGDGRKEIVLGGVDLKIVDIDHGVGTGVATSGVVATTAGGPYIEFGSGLAVADLDGDGGSEIVAFSNWPGGPTAHVYDRFLVEQPGWPLSGITAPSSSSTQRPTIGDLDGDGDLEVIFSCAPYGTLAYDYPNPTNRPLWVQWQSRRSDPTASASASASTGPPFLRGDANGDGSIDLADVVASLMWQFAAGASPGKCRDALDSNDDGRMDVADAIHTVMGLFSLGSATLATECVFDPTRDWIECTSQEVCPD